MLFSWTVDRDALTSVTRLASADLGGRTRTDTQSTIIVFRPLVD